MDILDERYLLLQQVGEGNFGVVFSADDLLLGRRVAVKLGKHDCEKADANSMEVAILSRVRQCEHLVTLFDNGAARIGAHGPPLSYIVLELLGMSLDAERKMGKRYSRTDVGAIGLAMLQALKYIHELGYVYRAVKPHNMVYREPGHQLVLVDMARCRRRVDLLTNAPLPPRRRPSFMGVPGYAGLRCHNRVEHSRADDILGLFYVLVQMWNSRGIWSTVGEDPKAIAVLKQTCALEDLTHDPSLINFYESISCVGFWEDPDYAELEKLLNQMRRDQREK